jgi:heme oxygenase
MADGKHPTSADGDLRSCLRAATMGAHEQLDHAMQASAGWQKRDDYACFLELQHAARVPLEDWIAHHAPPELRPPLQTPLIARDLAALDHSLPLPAPLFTLGRTAPGDALGAAWVLAGSALGNRHIAAEVKRIGGGAWPTAFLGDAAMLGFWKGLRKRLEQAAAPTETAGATRAAKAVFAHFLAVAEAARHHPASEGAAA